MSVNDVQAATDDRMKKSVDALRHDLGSIRTGRASPTVLDRVLVDYFGTPTPVQSLATIGVPEPRMITIQPWDKQNLAAIERAIQKSDIGMTPNSDGTMIRLMLPQLTDDRRKELVKMVQRRVEEGRVAIRNCRRDGLDLLRKEEKDKAISEDDLHHGQDVLQKLTDRFIAQVDEVGRDKEREILEP